MLQSFTDINKQNNKVAARLLVTLVFLSALPLLSLNMFLPSLSVMAIEFDVGYKAMAHTISAYLLCTAFIQIVAGPLADKFGRRPVLSLGLIIFIVASIGCAKADSYEFFFIWRVLQGGIATATVLSRAVIGDICSPQKSASLLGYIAIGMSVAPIIGPTLGGFIGETVGWRVNFFIYCFSGVALLFLVFLELPETSSNMNYSQTHLVDDYIALCCSSFFWAYSMVMACGVAGFFIFVTGIPIIALTIFEVSEAMTGIMIGSITCGFLMGSFFSAKLALNRSLDRMILYGRGLATSGLSVCLILLLLEKSHLVIVISSAISVGVGNGLATPSASAAVISVKNNLTASASGLSGALVVLIGSIATLITGSVVQAYPNEKILIGLMWASSMSGLIIAIWAALQRKRLNVFKN